MTRYVPSILLLTGIALFVVAALMAPDPAAPTGLVPVIVTPSACALCVPATP